MAEVQRKAIGSKADRGEERLVKVSTGSFSARDLWADTSSPLKKSTPAFTHATLGSIPASQVKELLGQGLTREDVRMVIPDRTLNRRIAQNQSLTVAEADGLARLLRVYDRALRLYDGRAELAHMFLHLPNPALNDAIPMELARTDVGAREVETVIGRIEHGVFS